MQPTPEHVLELAKHLVSAKETVANLTLQWDALFQVNTQSALPLKSASGINNGAKKKVLCLIDSEPQRDFTSEDVASALQLPIGTARTTLSKLVRGGAIEKRGTASYGAHRGSPQRLNEHEAISGEMTS